MSLLTITDVATEINVSRPTVRALIMSGRLQAIALPTSGARRVFRVSRIALDAFLQSCTRTEKGPIQ